MEQPKRIPPQPKPTLAQTVASDAGTARATDIARRKPDRGSVAPPPKKYNRLGDPTRSIDTPIAKDFTIKPAESLWSTPITIMEDQVGVQENAVYMNGQKVLGGVPHDNLLVFDFKERSIKIVLRGRNMETPND